jgi:YidC/Oxa1 family membrane protein insertase
MGFLLSIWDALKDMLEAVLRLYEGFLEPVLGQAAWGVAIILLTVTVRVLMIPLMVRQTRSMRSMQAIQPELKKIQEKYKADRSMMKTDPERYRKIKEKQREAQMALYQEHGVNPVGGCLPLLLQMPVFLALFQVLQDPGPLRESLSGAGFLGIPSLTTTARDVLTGETFLLGGAVAVITLILLQIGTTFFTQRQMMARNTTAGAEQQQAQKIMLYMMPPFLGFLSFTFPVGVVLYWVTTNVWTIGQQAFIFRQMEAEEARASDKGDQEAVGKAKAAQAEAVSDEAGRTAAVVDDPSGRSNGRKGDGGRGAAKGGPEGTGRGGSPSRNGGANGTPARQKPTAKGSRAKRTQDAAQRRQRGSGRSTQGRSRPR